MGRYVGKRILLMVPVLMGVTLLIFLLLHFTPGDPARMQLGTLATEEEILAQREKMGLNDPLVVQFGRYLKNLVTDLDLGVSYTSGRPVTTEIFSRYPTTILLAVLSVCVTLIIGIPTGILSAVKQYSWVDNISMTVGLVGISVPNFWLGLMLSLLFALKLRWLPASGFYGPKYWILPALSIGLSSAATIMRMTRSAMLEVIRQDYIRTARAKGQTERMVIIHHALKNALIPIITVVGIQFGVLLGGAMVTEQIFSVPGLGSYLVTAIGQRDYPVIQGGVLVMAFTSGLVNLAIDIIYSFVDPRIKSQYQKKKR